MIEDKLAKARASYKQKLQVRLDELEELIAGARDRADPAALAAAQHLAHKICGSSGTFGLLDVQQATAVIDRELLKVVGGQLEPNSGFWERIEGEMQRARQPKQ